MANAREKRSSVPVLGNETVAAKRRHASSMLNGKENIVPHGRPSGSKKQKLSQVSHSKERKRDRTRADYLKSHNTV